MKSRRLIRSAVSGLLVTSMVALSPIALPSTSNIAHAAPGVPTDAVALVIDGQGNGHGRGLSQYGAYGWATGLGDGTPRDWQWILDHYYGGTQNAYVAAGTRMTVRLEALDDKQTAVISARGNAYWVGGPAGSFGSMVAREISTANGQYTYRVWGASSVVCPSASDPLAGWTDLGTVTSGAGLPTVSFSVPGADDPATAAANLIGVCDAGGAVTYYRGNIYASNGSSGENRTVNDVDVEHYVRGVVPRESAASWADAAMGLGINALRAQAVAARSYALAQGGSIAGKRYTYAKTCDSTNCQAYGGAGYQPVVGGAFTAREDARSDRAVSDTALVMREKVTQPGAPVSTEFSSSNGRRTAGINFPAVDDAGDQIDYNPYVNWTRVIDISGLASRYGLSKITRVEMEADASVSPGTYGVTPAWAVAVRLYNGSQSVLVKGSALKSAYDFPSPSFTARLVKRDYATSDDFVFISDSVGASIANNDGTGELPILLNSVFNSATFNTESSRCTVGNCPPATADGLTVARALTGTPDVAIVELGYNDSSSNLAGEIDQVMQVLVGKGVRVVGWTTMSLRRTSNGTSSFAAHNRVLRAAASRWPQLRVLDWDGASVGGSRNRWYSDNVHLTSTGQANFALWLRDRAIELAGGTPGSPQWVVKVAPGSDLRVPITEAPGAPTGATGVSMNVTVVDPVADGYLTVWPCGDPQPGTSSLNFTAGQIVANAVISKIDATGLVCFASTVAAHVLVDVNSWFTAGAGFTPMVPARLFDTRLGTGGVPAAKVGALDGSGPALRVPVLGQVGIPSTGVVAVSMNVTVTRSKVDGSGGYVTVYPCTPTVPNVSSLNFTTDQTVPNAVIVPVNGPDMCFYVRGNADLIADVNGWFGSGSTFNALAPSRIADTRVPIGVSKAKIGKLDGTGGALIVPVLGVGGVPTYNVAAVSLNVTVANTDAPSYGGYVTVYPCGQTPPNASNLNFMKSKVVPNAVIAPVAADGSVCIYVYGQSDVIVDVNGWFAGGGGFTGMTPARVSDTRSGIGNVPGR